MGHAGESRVIGEGGDVEGLVVGAVEFASPGVVVGVGELGDGAGEHTAASESVCEGGLVEGAGGSAEPGAVFGIKVRIRWTDVDASIVHRVAVQVGSR